MVQDILEVDSPVLAGISGGLESEAEPVEELMTLKYPNEDTGSVIMEYMDTDVGSTQEVIQKIHGNLCHTI
ncbi:hypothetical protein ROHU_016086 [Labeo rohita]|uniref:Uncharacterized protein n=1 Tax=Labeo rohita TaxID=84645 RepID=A0A498NLR6_LABRO|nr:hypothetical protein ROHU_016086 [Labeo rohita]